jgi:uncharacterized Zn-finger protein
MEMIILSENIFTCQWCGKKFSRTDYQIRQSKRRNETIKFCSKECKNAYHGRNMVTLTCSYCGRQFKTGKRNVHKKYNFCSSECCHKYHEKNDDIGQTTKLICEWCGNVFEVKNSYIRKQEKRGQHVKFCCKECYSAYREYSSVSFLNKKEIDELYSLQKKIVCSNCGKPVHKTLLQLYKFKKQNHNFGGIFCCNECKNEYRNNHHIVHVKCSYCGKDITVNQFKYKHQSNFYCSSECFKKYKTKEKETYKEISHYLRSTNKYERWKEYILDRDNRQCTICGSKENLQVHHIYSLYNICNDNNFSIDDILNSKEFNDTNNGQTVCIKCHHKIHPWTHIKRDKNGQFLSHASSTPSEDEETENGKNLED